MQNKLYLIGLGLCDEMDLTLRALKALKECEFVYMENYTNFIREGTQQRIEELISKKINMLQREEVENEAIIIDSAKKSTTAIIIPGDPMVATTHNSLVESARTSEIEVKILHASSIFSAVAGATELQIYKMGKTATIPYWRKNFEPESFIDIIANNKKISAHTLCLLDIDTKLGPMKPKNAIEIIFEAQKRKIQKKEIEKEVLANNSQIFVVSRVGWEDEKVWFGKVCDCDQDFLCPSVIVIPSKLHFMEANFTKS